MRRIKPLYIVVVCLLIGVIIGYITATIRLKKQTEDVNLLKGLQSKMTEHLQEIDANYKELKDETPNKLFIRALIAKEIVDIDFLTPKEDSSTFSLAKKSIISNYVDYLDLIFEHDRTKKLLEFYENGYIPCKVKEINFGYVMNKINKARKITPKTFKNYKIPYNHADGDKGINYYLTNVKGNDNTRMLIIQDWKQGLITAYFVFDNKSKAIKTFHSNIKGGSCFRVYSKLFEDGQLEIYENNCKAIRVTTSHYRI